MVNNNKKFGSSYPAQLPFHRILLVHPVSGSTDVLNKQLGHPFQVFRWDMANMRKTPLQKYRDTVIVELKYIRKTVDKNEQSLDKLNGRVRETEKAVEKIKGIGSVLGIIFGGFIAWLYRMKGS